MFSNPVFRFIKDDYLQQNSFTKYDKYCPFYKSVEMMRNIAAFHRLATAAVEKTAAGNAEGEQEAACARPSAGEQGWGAVLACLPGCLHAPAAGGSWLCVLPRLPARTPPPPPLSACRPEDHVPRDQEPHGRHALQADQPEVRGPG